MKLFRVRWAKSLFAARVLAADGTECRKVAKEYNKERDGRLGKIVSMEVEATTPGVVGWAL